MGRPRKAEMPATEREEAPVQEGHVVTVPPPVAYIPPAPRQMRMARGGARSEPYVRHFPDVRGGVCEFCGVLDPNTPSQYQYKLCPHYRGMQLWCKYCPAEKDPDEVIRSTKLTLVEDPNHPGTLIAVCSSYDCTKRFHDEFRSN